MIFDCNANKVFMINFSSRSNKDGNLGNAHAALMADSSLAVSFGSSSLILEGNMFSKHKVD